MDVKSNNGTILSAVDLRLPMDKLAAEKNNNKDKATLGRNGASSPMAGTMATMAEEVTFCHFDRLFDLGLDKVLVDIFMRVGAENLEACVRVCHAWRVFIGRQLICGPPERTEILRARKLPLDWLSISGWPGPRITRMAITKTLAPPLSIALDSRDIIMTTIDSILVWDRATKAFRGEFGPELNGNNHCMVLSLSFNDVILVTLHKHTSVMLVWSRRNYKIIQEVQCLDMDGSKNSALFVAARRSDVIVWQEDGSVVIYAMAGDGTLNRKFVLNGHIQGGHDAALDGPHLLTASGDSKVNLWDLDAATGVSGRRGGGNRLLWSNSRSDARYRRARLCGDRAAVAGSYDREGYLQIYDRACGDVVHEMLTMEGSGFQDLAASQTKIVALLTIHHKLLSCKALVLNALNGDLLSEQTFVDVLHLRLVCDRALVLVNNQVGDFRTRISVFDLDADSGDMFGRSERVAFQYEHNYWKLPICLDEGAAIHTSEDKAELVVREYDHFFKQFSAEAKAGQLLTPVELERRRRRRLISSSTLCQRLRRILFKKLCAKCVIM